MFRRKYTVLLRGLTPLGSDRLGDLNKSSSARPDSTGSPRGLFERARHQRGQGRTNASGASPTSSSDVAASAKRYAQSASSASAGASGGAASAIHMYANKENAWHGYTDDRFYGAKRMKEYWTRMIGDRGVRYYVFGMLTLVLLAGAKLWQMQENQVRETGLLGPKKKNYRSRLTIVLDVDETILSYGDKAFRMKAGLVPRPYLAELLDYLASIDAEVVLWSACSERYMRQVLSVIDPSGIRVSQYITQSRDWFTGDNYYEKNIMWLKRPMEDTLIVENRPLSVRNCNGNAILVDDFIRGEYMDTGQDFPPNDQALRSIKAIIEDLETSGMPVQDYLEDQKRRQQSIKSIPCHLAIRQLPDEIARGVFYFVGDKYRMGADAKATSPAQRPRMF